MYCIFFYNIIYLYILVKNMNNYREFCNFFYAAHYLPLALYDQSRFLFAAGFSGAEDISFDPPCIYGAGHTCRLHIV